MLALNSAGTTRFVRPAPPLRKYITTYYFFEVESPGGTELEDLVHPEWASVRYVLSGRSRGSFMPDPLQDVADALITGPTIRARRIGCTSARLAGIGLLPLGWYRLVKTDAHRWANKSGDVTVEPEFALFGQIWDAIRGVEDYDVMAQVFDTHLLDAMAKPDRHEEKVAALHDLLTDPDLDNVGEMAERLGLNIQQVERLTRRAFGFPPKKLLRRQRFLRTLVQRLKDPDLKWGGALDDRYYDQAHFNRDFKDFMGMAPREYLAMPRPISQGSAQSREEQLGEALQGLEGPKRDA